MPTLSITFEDLPVLSELGFEAGSLSGRATVSFDQTGEWSVRDIFLDASRRATANEQKANPALFVRGEIEVTFEQPSPSWLYRAIWGQLTEGRFKRQIEKVVAAEVEEMLPVMAPQQRQQMAVA